MKENLPNVLLFLTGEQVAGFHPLGKLVLVGFREEVRRRMSPAKTRRPDFRDHGHETSKRVQNKAEGTGVWGEKALS